MSISKTTRWSKQTSIDLPMHASTIREVGENLIAIANELEKTS